MSDIKSDGDSRENLPSGRFLLRIDPELHATLRDAAGRKGISLNEYCSRKLGSPDRGLGRAAGEVVQRAGALFGARLVALVMFGSWARDEMAEDSDVDLLVVVDREVELTRELYRAWDERPITWGSRRVEPHFVQLPEPAARLSGLWAEVALDGVVLFDPELAVSRRLAAMRRRIVEGEIVRRETHGQPYWVEAA